MSISCAGRTPRQGAWPGPSGSPTSLTVRGCERLAGGLSQDRDGPPRAACLHLSVIALPPEPSAARAKGEWHLNCVGIPSGPCRPEPAEGLGSQESGTIRINGRTDRRGNRNPPLRRNRRSFPKAGCARASPGPP
ncbi:hypothetical protein HVPorG_04927 [Roseomonas mucosa]|nr:hypothetical protein HVPorG_04927 [Roseomonas mucosa]